MLGAPPTSLDTGGMGGRESPPLSECEVFLSSSSHQRRSTLEGREEGGGVNIWAAGCQGRRRERKGSPLYFRSPSLIPPSAAGRKEGIDLTGWTPRVPFFLSFAPHLLHTHTHSRTLLFLLPLCEIAPAARKATPATGATAPGAAVWYKIHHTASGPGRPKLASSKQKCKAGFLKQIPLGGESWLFLGRIIIPQSHIISQKSKEGGGGKRGRSSLLPLRCSSWEIRNCNTRSPFLNSFHFCPDSFFLGTQRPQIQLLATHFFLPISAGQQSRTRGGEGQEDEEMHQETALNLEGGGGRAAGRDRTPAVVQVQELTRIAPSQWPPFCP